tara:strand:- start:480 stop:1418 length:939 start_codon:yes stop_codon:yes gene_type:complete
MGVISNYFLNGTTLATSTGVFTDVALTACAPTGNYSDGVIVRYLDNATCTLGPATSCPSCASDCDGVEITHRGTEGVYDITTNLGANTGAIVIKYLPGDVPDGMYAVYNGVTYNAFSSEVDGYHRTSTLNGVTYLGDSTSGVCANTITTESPYTLPDYVYSGGAFAATGSSSVVTILVSDVSFSSQDPKSCYMVIPKLAVSPSTLQVTVVSYCKSASWGFKVACPTAIADVFNVSDVGATCSTQTHDNQYYRVRVSGNADAIAVNDWLFLDENGVSIVPDGDYKVEPLVVGDTHHLITMVNGVVTARTDCPN